MKKLLKNNRGFTLVEMMIVLLIISVLILISIPNVTKHSANIDEKSCQAFVNIMRGISNLSKKPVVSTVESVP